LAEQQERQRRNREERRQHHQAAVVEQHRPRRSVLPRRRGHEQRADRPERVEQRVLHVRAASRLVEEDAVGGSRDGEACREQRPRASGTPAGQSEHRGGEGEQEEVEDRVGEVGGHCGGGATRGVEHRREDERRRDGRDRARGEGAVEPVARAEGAAEPRTHEQDQGRIAQGVCGEPHGVRRRRVGRLGEIGEREGPVHLTRRLNEQRRAEQAPRNSLIRAAPRAGDA
jgi:hypothetical protein